jgi:hypothetical protein
VDGLPDSRHFDAADIVRSTADACTNQHALAGQAREGSLGRVAIYIEGVAVLGVVMKPASAMRAALSVGRYREFYAIKSTLVTLAQRGMQGRRGPT